jgi:hypothetical protein
MCRLQLICNNIWLERRLCADQYYRPYACFWPVVAGEDSTSGADPLRPVVTGSFRC